VQHKALGQRVGLYLQGYQEDVKHAAKQHKAERSLEPL
jgi:hypothetical protein